MPVDLGPKDEWPRHSRKLAQQGLTEARRAGWYFRKGGSSSHLFGTIRCPAVGDDGRCAVRIFSTSKSADGSNSLIAIRSEMRSCPHGPTSRSEDVDPTPDHEDLSDEAIEARVERLVEAADGLLRRGRSEQAVEAAYDSDDEVAFSAHSQDLVEAENLAQVAFATLGLPLDPWPPEVGVAELAKEASRLADLASEPSVTERLRTSVDRLSE